MRTLLSILQEDHNGGRLFEGNFMDVGSGNGAAIVCAAMTGRFHESKGIEYDETRHQEAILLQDAYQRKKVKKDRNEVHLVKGDIGHFPELLDDASVVFCNSVVFDPELSAAVGKMLDLNEKLAFPRIVVSVSRRFPCPTFNLVDVFKMFSNTGKEFTFFVQQKQQLIASSPAVSDSLEMVYLLKEEELFRALVEMAVDDSKEENKHDRMAVLSAIGMSESGTRVLLKNKNFLSSMASQMFRIEDLPSRASSSMVLRAVASFPVGRRVIAESDTVMDALLANVSTSIAQKDHPAIRANVLDILGQVLQDSVGQEIITRDIDDWLQANMDLAHKEGWEEVIDACLEIQMMQRWWKGELRYRIE